MTPVDMQQDATVLTETIISPTEAVLQSEWHSLEPYGQLLRVLLPRMSGFSVFNARGDLCWSSDMTLDAETREAIDESIRAGLIDTESAGQLRIVNDEEPVYVFWLRPESGDVTRPFAIVAIRCRPGFDTTERGSFAFVQSLVRPAMECLRRELQARDKIINLHSSLLEQDHDLDMLLAVSGGKEGLDESGDDLKAILRGACQHIETGLVALLVPEKGLVLVQQGDTEPLDSGLVAKAHRHLLSTAQLHREAVIVNRLRLQSGDKVGVFRILSCPVSRSDGRSIGVLALFRAESSPKFTMRHSRLAELLARRIGTVIASAYDALTGLLTRPAFENRVRSVLSADTSAQSWWSALYVDVNRMHVINDTYGMHIGDKVITQIGELIRRRVPPGAIAARISGDRFAILIPAGLQDAAGFGESLRQGAEDASASIGDGKMQVSVSIGVASVEPRNQEFTHPFAAAETACKAANDRGRNRVEVFQEADESLIRRFTDINVMGDLRAAIAEDRMRLNAQLIIGLGQDRSPPHFEILLRMINDRGETVGPDHFMSAAQRYQLMPEIDRWVIAKSLEMLKDQAATLAAPGVVFSINVSGQSIKDESFADYLADQISASGINPAALCFELTESAAVGDLARAETMMRKLRKLGCGIALDDFGTGLSSLAYLRSLPITMLKIDGSFVRDVLLDPKAESMIRAISQLAHAMSLVTVAEFVETEEIRTRIASLGVDYGQGFAIGRPMPLAEVLEQLPLYAAASNPTGIWRQEPALAM
ncbi:MAG: EAL domain-containing protein [Steroidobacteraceae bacterium]